MDTDRLVKAFRYAAELHASQQRKGTSIPYISHLMAVAAIVIEHGGDEDQAVAALLHDAIEDHPANGRTRDQIHERFGARVLALVEACSDAHTDRAILADVRQTGEQVWDRFNVPKEKQLWYYRALADIFLVVQPGFLADELKRTVTELERLAAS